MATAAFVGLTLVVLFVLTAWKLGWLPRITRTNPQPEQEFEPENHLERLLVKAASDPAMRPEFYRAFLDSEVYVLGQVEGRDPLEDVRFVARAGDRLMIAHLVRDGQKIIPIFSSVRRVAEHVKAQETYIGLTARALLEMTGACELVLNPSSAFGKQFTREEVASLLDGSLFQPTAERVVQEDEQVLVGKPAQPPATLVTALQTLFTRRGDVERAYLAQYHRPSTGEPPHLLLAISVDEGVAPSVAADCGLIARDVLPAGESLDIMELRGTGAGIEEYFAQDEPIFVRV